MASNFKIQNLPSLLGVQVSQFPPKPSFSTFNFISRSIILPQFRASIPLSRLHCLSLSSSSPSSSPVSGSENSSIEHPFEVSYLMNTFGWPPELAISKAKFLKFKSPKKPEKMLELFKKYGFTETQISLIIKKRPELLLSNLEETILPKFEFLRSLGLSTTEITQVLTKQPKILTRSLENTVKPAFKLLRSLVSSDDEAVKMVKRSPRRLTYVPEDDEHSFGVSYLMNTFGWPPEFAISKAKFLKFKSPEKPERVLAFFKNYGFTEIQISHIVKKQLALLLSNLEETILPKFEFLRSLGLSTTEITQVLTKQPKILSRSLENTVEPAFKHLRSLVSSDDEAVRMVKRSPSRLIYGTESSSDTEDEDSSIESSFEVSYLINTFGWPPEVAISKAKNLKFETPEKPERVLAFLKNYGFTKSQISHIIKILPKLLLGNPEETYLPKLEFLWSRGLSRTEVTGIVTKEPRILRSSLEKMLVPWFDLMLNLVKSDDEAVGIVIRYPILLTRNPEVDIVQILLEEGVPGANIVAYMVGLRGTVTPDSFRKMVEKVKEMGFDPRDKSFLQAIKLSGKYTWEDKVQVLKKYGWSDREIMVAFRKFPGFIVYSNDRIERVMDFLVNRMGVEATDVAHWPHIIQYRFEKRIVPRCLVYQSVLEKGLYERKSSLRSCLTCGEPEFLAKFIRPYENEAPELWDLYKKPLC